MRIINSRDIMETIEMLTAENLDVRTVTMGISLLDCIDPDGDKACEKIYNKIVRLAGNLVPVVDGISAEYGIPIVNKRISVTPIAMLLGAAPDADPVQYAKALDRAAKAVGVNFIGGFGALVHKGFSAGDKRLIEAIPRALAETDIVCSSVNIGSTKSGINMDAVKLMGQVVRETAELTKDNMCMGDAKLVVFCNAPEDNPFMAGAFHGAGEPDCEIHVGVSGPGAVRAALAKLPKDAPMDEVAELVKEDVELPALELADDPAQEPEELTAFEKYADVYAQNSDLVGWISIPGTRIDYPVMQTKDNPNFYLKHAFDKSYSSYGVPYMQENCDVGISDNLMLYGHHMNNGSMFSDLCKYESEDFYREHKTIRFDTLDSFGEYEVIAAFKTVAYSEEGFKYYHFVNAESAGAFDGFIAECKALALYETSVSAEYGDQLITLSTCEYSRTNGRMVVVAKLLEK